MESALMIRDEGISLLTAKQWEQLITRQSKGETMFEEGRMHNAFYHPIEDRLDRCDHCYVRAEVMPSLSGRSEAKTPMWPGYASARGQDMSILLATLLQRVNLKEIKLTSTCMSLLVRPTAKLKQ